MKTNMRKHRQTPLRAWGTALAVAWLAAALAQAGTYQITNLGTVGGKSSVAFGLNNNGQVVGQSANTDGDAIHAFMWDAAITDLGALAGTPQSIGFDINDSGQVVGVSYALGALGGSAVRWDAGTPTVLGSFTARAINNVGMVAGVQLTDLGATGYVPRAVMWDAGTLTFLGTLGGASSDATDINASGWIVGGSNTSDGKAPRAFVWIAGTMTELPTLGGMYGFAYGINDAGQIVGVSRLADGSTMHAFMMQVDAGGNVLSQTDLGELGGGISIAYGINSAGQVVGTSNDTAFIWDQGLMSDLNTMLPPNSGWVLRRATAINDAGQIAGQGLFNGLRRAFLLTPATTCTGDLNGDGQVDATDLGILLANFGTASGATPDQGDIDGDGDVDISDLGALLAVFGTPCV